MQTPVQEKKSTKFENLIEYIGVQNKEYSELASRVERIAKKLIEEPEPETTKGSVISKPTIPGHVSRIDDAIDYFRATNGRMEKYLQKIEAII